MLQSAAELPRWLQDWQKFTF